LWQAVVARHARSAGKLALLEQALHALDRADELREAVSREGLTVKTERTGVIHVHPALRLEQLFRQQFVSAWCKLGLAHDGSRDTPFAIERRGDEDEEEWQ
jgi:phage terminase small subunit